MEEFAAEFNGACSSGVDPPAAAGHACAMTRAVCALAALALAGPWAAAAPPAPSDEDALRQLNDDYVRAYLACDVARFQALLADDFSGVLADGRVIDRAQFLAQAAQPPDARELRQGRVTVRVFGDTALVASLVGYRRSDGTAVRTRYSAVYVRRGQAWRIVWVQWTRVAQPPE
jgi:ketosteroid isomerase-like protein